MSEYRNFTRNASPPPLVGALLRRPLQEVRRRIHANLVASGFDDIHPAHLNVFQYPGPRGMRPSQLARAADMTKQAMNHLLGQLTALGYLERRSLPGGKRGTTIWTTARGEAAVKVMRETVTALEAEWAAILGKQRFRELRILLGELNAHVDLGQQSRATVASLVDKRPAT
jgi:DNA-binding MarR family transcriptional regulator